MSAVRETRSAPSGRSHRGRTARGRRRHRRRIIRRVVALVVLAVVVAVAAAIVSLLPAAGAALDARTQLSAIQAETASLRQDPSPAALDALDGHDARLMADLRTIGSAWSFWQRPALFVSRVNGRLHGQLAQVTPLLRYGLRLGEAGQALVGPLRPLLALRHAGPAVAPALVADLASSRPALHQARALVVQAIQARRDLRTADLPAQVSGPLGTLDGLLPGAPTALDALDALPAALGADGPREYLVVPQNTADLRASGGFIGTVAVLRVDHGRARLASSQSSYAVDRVGRPNVDPPLPLAVHGYAAWYFRDANWSADFPTNAALLQVFYESGTGRHVDGTISFNSTLLPSLIGVTGPVAVPGYGETLTLANAYDRLNYLVNAPGQPGKPFAAAAYAAVFAHLLELPSLGGSAALDLARAGIRARDLQLYANDPAVERAITAVGADGALAPTRGDYLYVVDTNTSANKINPLVRQGISYQAVIGADRAIAATVTITYANGAAVGNTPAYNYNGAPDYADFVRVFVPAGSTLTNPTTTGLDEVWPTYTVHAKTQFSGWFALPSHASRTITLRYRIPANADAGNAYHLLVQRQSGAPIMPLRIDVSAASGVRLGASHTGLAVSDVTTLDADVTVARRLSGGRPRPVRLDYGLAEPVIPGSQPEQWVTVPSGRVGTLDPLTTP